MCHVVETGPSVQTASWARLTAALPLNRQTCCEQSRLCCQDDTAPLSFHRACGEFRTYCVPTSCRKAPSYVHGFMMSV